MGNITVRFFFVNAPERLHTIGFDTAIEDLKDVS